jgi:hypothetical protein
MAVGRVIGHPVAPQTAAVAANQIRGDATFVEKDEAGGVNRRRDRLPLVPRGDDVGAGLFGRAYRFF